MAWIAVITAGLLEVGFAIMLKLSNNFTKLWPSIGFVAFAWGSFSLLAWSLKVLPIGTAYAVWTGIGAAGTAILGMVLFKDPVSIARITAIHAIYSDSFRFLVSELTIFSSGPWLNLFSHSAAR